METMLSKVKKDSIILFLFILYVSKLLILGTEFADVGITAIFACYLGFERFVSFKFAVKEQKELTSLQAQLNTLNGIISNGNITKIVKRDEQKTRKF
jgi:hypothetical protein